MKRNTLAMKTRKQIIGLVAVVLAGAAFNAVAAQYADGVSVREQGRPVMLNRHKNGDVRKVAVNFGITF